MSCLFDALSLFLIGVLPAACAPSLRKDDVTGDGTTTRCQTAELRAKHTTGGHHRVPPQGINIIASSQQYAQKTIQSPDRLYKAPTNYTKPQQTIQSPRKTIQSPDRLYKDPERLYKHINIRQKPKILDKDLKS